MTRLLNMHPPPVRITPDEYERLADIICASPEATEGLVLLWSEIQRAIVINPADAPDDLVRMGEIVEYRELPMNVPKVVRLVYDNKVVQPGDLAITTVLGAALIGLRAGATFVWNDGEGVTHAIRIERVRRAPAEPPFRGRRRGRRDAERPSGGSTFSRIPPRVRTRPKRRPTSQSAPGGKG